MYPAAFVADTPCLAAPPAFDYAAVAVADAELVAA